MKVGGSESGLPMKEKKKFLNALAEMERKTGQKLWSVKKATFSMKKQ